MATPSCAPRPGGRPLDQPVEREHAERQPRRHEQLNVRGVCEHMRAEREEHRRHRRRTPVVRQVAHQVVHPDGAQRKRQQHRHVRWRHRDCPPSPSRPAAPACRPRCCSRSRPACRDSEKRYSRRTGAPDRPPACARPRRHSRSTAGRRRCRPGRRVRSARSPDRSSRTPARSSPDTRQRAPGGGVKPASSRTHHRARLCDRRASGGGAESDEEFR